jgi:NitT/TauT family transport system substrate-binding protein
MKFVFGRGLLTAVVALARLWLGSQNAQCAEPLIDGKPEKNQLEVAIAASGPLYLPLLVAHEAGYFSNHGLTLSLSVVSGSTAAQGILSGKIDIYQGGAVIITANLAGGDLIYIAAAVDRSTLVLFGQNGLNSVESLRGKSVATTSPGAFGEIAMRRSAREHGLEVGKDIKLLYHRSTQEAFATFLATNADGLIITPPQSDMARNKGYPVIVDYYKQGLRIIGPGIGLTRTFMQGHPKTVRAYLKGYLDGVKRCFDDPAYAAKINAKYNKISDSKALEESYQQGAKVWNKDLTVDPEAIRLVLAESGNPKAGAIDAKRFYDNSIIREVNREYAAKLFPGEVR